MATAQVWKGDKNPGICPAPRVQPSAGVVALDARDWIYPNFVHTYHLLGARLTVTDAGASGSHGTYKLDTFAEGMVRIDSASLHLISTVEGSTLTGGAGNAVYKLSVGSTPISVAADAALSGVQADIVAATANITNASGTGSGSSVSGTIDVLLDGRTTPASLNLNFSGTAASISASSTLDITAKVIVSGTFLGDA